MHISFSRFFDLAKKSVNAWLDDYAPSMGAAIAYYTIFSIAPLLIIVIAVAGWIWGEEAVRGELFSQIASLVGADGAAGIQALLSSAAKPEQGLISGAISLVILIVGATTVFAELQSALDRIWQVPADEKKSGLWNTLRARLLSFGLVLGLAFLLMVSLVTSAALSALGSWVGGLMPGWEILLQIINQVLSIGLTAVLFAMIYKYMPQVKIAWRDVLVGGLVTAVLFGIGRYAIGVYIGTSAVASPFAAAGSLVVLLVWVYYAAQIFLLGAEFTWVYANEHGSHAPANGGRPAPAAKALPSRSKGY